MQNNQIYELNQKLFIFAKTSANIQMPVRINFYLQKNIRLIQEAAEEIERARLSIGAQFGVLNTAGTGYDIPHQNISAANKELQDLLELEQDLNIHKFKLDDFNGIELTFEQMSAIMFMIDE